MEIGGTKSDLAIDNIDIEDGECQPNAVFAECKTFDRTNPACHYVDDGCTEGMFVCLFVCLFVWNVVYKEIYLFDFTWHFD